MLFLDHEFEYFVCNEGIRIYIGGQCDGVFDCYDGEDEIDCCELYNGLLHLNSSAA